MTTPVADQNPNRRPEASLLSATSAIDGARIPLISLGQTVWFFPDFLVWVDGKVLCIDTKGDHLVETDSRRKLLTIEPHPRVSAKVEVKFVTEGRWKSDGTPDSKDGYSIWQLGSGQALRTLPFEDLASLVGSFVPDESDDEDDD
jgi:type III restriction enzyme